MKIDKNNLFILIIALLSIAHIFLNFRSGNYLSLVVSLVGIIAVLLFFTRKDAFRYLMWLWIAAQAFSVDHEVYDAATGYTAESALLDLAQVFRIKVGISFSMDNNAYGLNFNLITLLYVFLFRKLRITAWIGKSIRLHITKGNKDIRFDEGLSALLKQRVNIEGDDGWLLAALSSPLIYNQQPVEQLLVQTEVSMLTHIFLLVPHDKKMDRVNRMSEFDYADWIRIA